MTQGRRVSRTRRARSVLLGFSGVVGAIAMVHVARGDVITAWHFNEVRMADPVIKADVGVGMIEMADLAGGWESFQGTSLNAVDDWIAGDALGVRGWKWNDSSMLLGFESHALSEVSLSMAARRSSTGFTSLLIESLGSIGWIELSMETIALDWAVLEVSIPVEVLQEGAPLLRLTVMGATTSQGTVRFDNIRIDGIVVPGPGGVCAFAPAALLHRRRRRRRC